MTIDNLVSEQQATQIYKENYPIIFNYLRRSNIPIAEAEDCAHQALTKGLMKLDQYRGDAKLSTWLIGIAVNEYRMYLRQKKARDSKFAFAFEDHEPTDPNDYSEIAVKKVMKQQVFNLIYDRLSEKHTVILRFLEKDYLGQEIADELSLSYNSARSRVRRARIEARELIEEEMNLTIQDLV